MAAMKKMETILLLATVVAVTMILPLAGASSAETAKYKDGSTVVAQNEGEAPTADSGLVVCNPADRSGQGGVCFSYSGHGGGGWSVNAVDNSGFRLAYRVCLTAQGNTVDNNGVLEGDCDDAGNANHFSHGFVDSPGDWRIPTRVVAQPVGVTFEWIVVFTCDAVMQDYPTTSPPTYHSHGVTTGTVSLNNNAGTEGFVPPEALCGGGGTHKYEIHGLVPDPLPNNPAGVPTLSEWGLAGLAAGLVVIGVLVAARRRS